MSALRQTTSILCLRLRNSYSIPTCTRITPRWGHHFHAYLGFESAVRIRSASRLDFDSIIQISSRFEQAIVELGTTSERMVTSSTRSATRLIQLVDRVGAAATLYGLRLYAQNLKKNFIRSCETELRDIISYITDNSNNTPRNSYGVRPQPYESPTLRTLLDQELPNGRARRLSETTEEDTDGEV